MTENVAVSKNDFGIRVTPGTITGLVWSDDDRDGFRADDERMLEGIGVDLLAADSQVVSTTLTAANGQYEFRGVVPVAYAVRVHANGMLHVTLQDELGSDAYDSDAHSVSGVTANILVAPAASSLTAI